MLLLIIISLELLYSIEEINCVDVNVNGYIQLEPRWLFEEPKGKQRSVVHDEDVSKIHKTSEEKDITETTVSVINVKDKQIYQNFKKIDKVNKLRAEKEKDETTIEKMDQYLDKLAESGVEHDEIEEDTTLKFDDDHETKNFDKKKKTEADGVKKKKDNVKNKGIVESFDKLAMSSVKNDKIEYETTVSVGEDDDHENNFHKKKKPEADGTKKKRDKNKSMDENFNKSAMSGVDNDKIEQETTVGVSDDGNNEIKKVHKKKKPKADGVKKKKDKEKNKSMDEVFAELAISGVTNDKIEYEANVGVSDSDDNEYNSPKKYHEKKKLKADGGKQEKDNGKHRDTNENFDKSTMSGDKKDSIEQEITVGVSDDDDNEHNLPFLKKKKPVADGVKKTKDKSKKISSEANFNKVAITGVTNGKIGHEITVSVNKDDNKKINLSKKVDNKNKPRPGEVQKIKEEGKIKSMDNDKLAKSIVKNDEREQITTAGFDKNDAKGINVPNQVGSESKPRAVKVNKTTNKRKVTSMVEYFHKLAMSDDENDTIAQETTVSVKGDNKKEIYIRSKKEDRKNKPKAGKVENWKAIDKMQSMDEYFNKMSSSGIKNDEVERSNGLIDKPYYVKEDKNIKKFIEHIYKRSLKALDSVKKKLNTTKLKKRAEELTDSYKQRIGEFVKEILEQKIKTSIGQQKVVMNILQVNDRMLRTVMNGLYSEIRKQSKGHLRDAELVAAVDPKLDHTIEKNIDQQYAHACQKLKICRSDHGFSQFLASVITEILKNDDDKLSQANDALAEVLTYANFDDIIKDRKKLNKKITYLENLKSEELRTTYQNVRNMLMLGNKVMTVYVNDDRLLNKSLALRDLMDIFERSIPPTAKNQKEWKHIMRMTQKWSLGKEDNIQDVMKMIVKEILRKSINSMSSVVTQHIRENVAVLL